MVSWPTAPSSTRSASMIIPAQVPSDRHPGRDPLAERLEQVEDPGQLGHRGGLAARDDEAVAGLELRRPAYGAVGDAERLERGEVLAHVALQGEHADGAALGTSSSLEVPRTGRRIRNGTFLMRS